MFFLGVHPSRPFIHPPIHRVHTNRLPLLYTNRTKPKEKEENPHPHAVPDELLDGLKDVPRVARGQGAVEEHHLALAVLGDGAKGGEGQVEEVLQGGLMGVCVCVCGGGGLRPYSFVWGVGGGEWIGLLAAVGHQNPRGGQAGRQAGTRP